MEREIKSIVITGPTGAIGMAVINACIKKGIRMLLISRGDSKRNKNIQDSELITLLYADIEAYDEIDVKEYMRKYDAFLHLAWRGTTGESRNDMELQTGNIMHTLSAVRLAHRLGCKVFMGAGSQAEYGRVEGYLNDKVMPAPENGYGMAKLCAGQMSRVLCRQLQLEHIWLRVLSIYGPYDNENSMVISAIRGFAEGKETAFTPGEQKWDYLYSGDAANMILKLLSDGKDGRLYCIGSGREKPLKDYIHDIYKAVCGMDVTEEKLGIGKIPYAPKQVMFLCADISELEADIGSVQLTPFSEGIKETVEWYQNRK